MKSTTFYAHTFSPAHLSKHGRLDSFKQYYSQGKVKSFTNERIIFQLLDLTKTVEIWRIAAIQFQLVETSIKLIGFEAFRSFINQEELISWRQQMPFQFTREPLNLELVKGDDVIFRVCEYIVDGQFFRAVCLADVGAQ
ncbi:hypothetical protein SS50377_27344 [Spironucleus salmonicida]|uniref:Uncharacterized protein n=1 Tax=Spironucleus salmonicida TaxID=348837 RepID=V6LFN4_9EUKA|nr:hypothetical protein SS50377_27344 [Spironucleus salmonicida]|eukprot:EST43355.1 Hypothetical protein SS50377_17033 [Spironucleus salmonicida]